MPTDLLAEPAVTPSGQGVVVVFRDPATNALAPVATLSDQREIQSLTLGPAATTAPFTLTQAGHTTAPIAKRFTPPSVYYQWNPTLPAPGSYELAVNLPSYAPYRSPAVTYEIFDGNPATIGTLLATVRVSHAGPDGTTIFTDGTTRRSAVDGLQPWGRLGVFTFAGTAAHVRVSCAPGSEIYCDNLRIKSIATGAEYRVDPACPPAQSVGPSGQLQQYPSFLDCPGSSGANHNIGLGAGGYPTLDPAAVQAALEALPGGSGNYTCSGTGTTADPLLVHFVGGFGQQALPLLTTSDPNVVVARTSAGGNWPTISRNGGPPLSLHDLCGGVPNWGTGHGDPDHPTLRTNPPYSPMVIFNFIQAMQSPRHEKILAGLNTATGSWSPSPRTGYADIPQQSTTTGDHATFIRQGIPPTTVRFSLTWTAHASNTPDAVLTITNRLGTTLASYHFNQTLTPSGSADDGVPWQVGGSVTTTAFVDDLIATLSNAAGSGVLVADAVRFERTSADNSIVIAPGEVVTYSCGFGWAASPAGSAPAAANVTVANRVGGSLYPPVNALPKSMGVGYNINQTFTYSPVLRYANLVHGGYQEPGEVLARDSDDYPTRFTGNPAAPTAALAVFLVTAPQAVGGDGRGWVNVPVGPYTAFWDGTSDVTIDGTENTGRASFTGSTGHRRVFNVPAVVGNYSPNIIARLHSSSKNGDNTFNLDVRNWRVYIGDLDTDPAGKFTPGILAKVTGTSSCRFLNPGQAIQGCARSFDDFNRPASAISRYGNRRLVRAQIAEVRGGSGFWRPDQGVILQVTTTAPHGLGEADYVVYPDDPGTAQLSDGSTLPLNTYGPVHILTPTVYTYQQGVRGTPAITMTNIVGNVGGSLLCRAGNNDRLADLVDFCNATGTDFYLNTPITSSDEALDAIGYYLGTHLTASLKVRAEPINEPWNYQFSNFNYMVAQTYAQGLGDGWVPYYCQLAKRHWQYLRQGWVRAGRAAGDLLRVAGSQWNNPGVTDGLAARFALDGTAFDLMAIAPYTGIGPSPAVPGGQEPSLLDLGDLLTTGQDLDYFEACYTWTGYEDVNPLHRAALDAHGFTEVGEVAYEGGPSGEVPYFAAGVRLPSRMAERSHACHRHPRRFGLMLHMLRQEQDSGMTGPYHLYQLSAEGDQVFGGTLAMWSAANGTDQALGTGDPTADAANIATPDRMDIVKTQIVGAVSYWQSLIGVGGTPPVPPPPPPIPTHVLRRVRRGRSLSRRR